MPKSLSITQRILQQLESGEKSREDICDLVGGKRPSVNAAISRLLKNGEIEKLETGMCRLKTENHAPPPAEIQRKNSRSESENIETINKMLTLYDVLLEDIAASLGTELATKATIEEKIDLIKSMRWLGATIDQLMKRWYLVHRGYDTNTRQAQEDAKAKAREVEKEEVANLPPEERVVVVGEYDNVMKRLWDGLPESEKARRTV